MPDLGNDVVDKGTVMTYQQQGSLIAGQQFLKQFKSFNIEIVGRFIHNQYIEFLKEQFCQQQTVLFTAGESFHRNHGTTGFKQKILQITDYMFAVAVHLNLGSAVGKVVNYSFFTVKLFTVLIKIGNFNIGSGFNRSSGRFQLTEKKFEQS